jgi:putative oxidoreductase
MTTFDKLADLVGRALLALIFVLAAYGKITQYAGTQGYMASAGVPGQLLPLVILTELGGGLAILLGWQTRIAALLLAGFTLLAAALFHSAPQDQIMLLKNLAIAGGFLVLAARGAGAWSLDARRATPAEAAT